MTVCIIDLRSD